MTPSIADRKRTLRRQMKAVRCAIPTTAVVTAAYRAAVRVRAMLAPGDVVCIYVSYRAELPTHELIVALLADGVRVAVPRIEGPQMVAREIHSWSDLVPGERGIATSDGADISDQVRVCLVPGLAFTHEGHRLGYGGGYYDRFLARHHKARPYGLSFERQMVPTVPLQDHDVPMLGVVTDCGVHDPEKSLKSLRVVAGAVVRDGCVLAARRGPGMLLAGCWELPGGKVESGEDDRTALARELFEELGIRVEVTDLIGDWEHPYPTARVHLIAYAARLIEGEPKVTEHDALAWLEPRDLHAMGWAPADVPLIAPLLDWLSDAE